jgi:hypothetical protein
MKKFLRFAVFALLAMTTATVQAGNLKLFGDYSYGWSRLTAATSSELSGPLRDVANGLKSGTYNQFEIGTYIKGVGIGFIHNGFSSDANVSYSGFDLNGDGHTENGSVSDDFSLAFNGLELKCKVPVLLTGMNLGVKCALGIESYKAMVDYNIGGQYPGSYSTKTTGNTFCSLLGAELNYSILGIVNLGVEASLMPGNFKNLTVNGSSSSASDNAMRFNAGIHIGVTL